MGDYQVNNNENQENPQEQTEIKELITRAIQDAGFKALLISDPDRAMESYNLTDVQKMLIKSLREEDINKLTPENLEEFFSADAAVYTPDTDAEFEMEEAGEEDI